MVPYRDSVLTKLLQNALGGNRYFMLLFYEAQTCVCVVLSLVCISLRIPKTLSNCSLILSLDGRTTNPEKNVFIDGS